MMYPIKRSRLVQLIWAAFLVGIAPSSSERNKQALVIKHTNLPHERLLNNSSPLSYNVTLSLLDGFSTLKGQSEITLKFTGNIVKQHLCSALSQARCKPARPAKEDGQILLHMDGRFDIRRVTLQVSHTLRTLRKGRGRKVVIDEILRDNKKRLILITSGEDLRGLHGRLKISYSSRSLQLKREAASSFTERHRTRLEPGNAAWLFPCFDEPQLEARVALNFYQPDIDNGLVSNIPRDGSEFLMFQVKTGSAFEEARFESREPIAVNKLAFALGPFHSITSEPTRDISEISTLVSLQPSQVASGFAREFLRQSISWMRTHFAAITDRLGPLEALAEGQYLKLKTKTDPNAPNVETALWVGLLLARKGLGFAKPESPSDLWIVDGLAAHLAVRMVRELQPRLRVDQFVRSELLPTALKLDAAGAPSLQDGGRSREKSLPTVFLRLIKGAALFDMIKRTISLGRESFDGAVLSFLSGRSFGMLEFVVAFARGRYSQDLINEFVGPWIKYRGFPYIGMSLNRRDRSLSIDQVPISWLTNSSQVEMDTVWPLDVQVKFSNSLTISESRNVALVKNTASLRIELPNWFNHNNPKHKFWLASDDKEAILYHRVSYSLDHGQD